MKLEIEVGRFVSPSLQTSSVQGTMTKSALHSERNNLIYVEYASLVMDKLDIT